MCSVVNNVTSRFCCHTSEGVSGHEGHRYTRCMGGQQEKLRATGIHHMRECYVLFRGRWAEADPSTGSSSTV